MKLLWMAVVLVEVVELRVVGEERIVGGEEAGMSEVPWQVTVEGLETPAGFPQELPRRHLPLLRRHLGQGRLGGDGLPLPGRPLQPAVRGDGRWQVEAAGGGATQVNTTSTCRTSTRR